MIPVWLLPDRVIGRQAAARPALARAARSHSKAGAALNYRPDIDGLRGVAVVLVVAYHAFPNLRTGGFIGVDVFFVISGYLITQLVLSGLQRGTFSLSEFYRRRVRRIVPALIVVIMACCIAGWFLLLPSELKWLGNSVRWCVPFLANVYFARTGGYFDRVAEFNPLIHLWSLGVEEQFYLAWPLLLIFAVKRGVTMRVLGAVTGISLAYSIWSAWYGSSPHFYNPATRAWELAVGGMLAAWPFVISRGRAADLSSSRSPLWYGRHAISLVGLALIGAGGVFWTADTPIPGIWSAIPAAGTALLIGVGPHATANRWFLASRPMTFIGQISYPLYLWHWPLLSFTLIVLGHRPEPAMALGEMAIAFAAAYATYRLVELPIRSGELGRRAVPALLAGLALLALAGAALDAGWVPGRLTGPVITQWNQAVTDWHYPGDSKIDKRTGFGTLTVTSRRDREVLFIGDSHIQQYWPRVRRIIDEHPETARSAVFAAYLGCPPMPGIRSPWRDTNCSGFFDYAMDRAYRPDVDTVVFGAFWEYYFLGEYAAKYSVPRVYGVPALARPPLELDSPSTQIAFEQFQRAVAGLVASGRRVYIVLSNPTSPRFEPLFPPELRLSLHLPRSLPPGSAPHIDVGPFEAFVAPLTRRLQDIAAQTGATAIDPRSSLCEGTICPAADSNELPLYLDSHHLNGSNARERASFVDEMLLGPDAPSADSVPVVRRKLPLVEQ